jgi:cbb3-type cytochrome oxidase subunit 3
MIEVSEGLVEKAFLTFVLVCYFIAFVHFVYQKHRCA